MLEHTRVGTGAGVKMLLLRDGTKSEYGEVSASRRHKR
jgi:hypothetical protein